MRPKKYPLDPLIRVLRDQVDASLAGLSAAVRTREEAARLRAAAEAERERALEVVRQAKEVERTRLTSRGVSAAELQRQGAWETRAQWADDARGRTVAAARDTETGAHAAEEKARGDLTKAEAEAKVVSRHREHWLAAEERAAEARAEEGALEAWRPRR